MGKTEPTEKFRKLNQQKIHISSFPSIDGNGISVSAIMKKLKNGSHFVNINHIENFQLQLPQSLGLSFSECRQKRNISVGHYEKIEKCLSFR